MPITIKPNKVKFKDPEKQGFIELNSVAESSTEEFLDRINNVADSALNNISTAVNNANEQAATLDSKVELISNSIASVQTYGVDDTLTLAHAAAEAKIVGNKINQLENIIGTTNWQTRTPEDATPVNGYYSFNNTTKQVTLAGSDIYVTSNSPIDISDLRPGTLIKLHTSSNNNYGCYITDAQYHLLQFINGHNAPNYGLQNTSQVQQVIITVPEGAKYIVMDIRSQYFQNDYFNIQYKNENIIEILQKELNKNKEISLPLTWTTGALNNDNSIRNETSDDRQFEYSQQIYIAPYKKIRFSPAMSLLYYNSKTKITSFTDIVMLDNNHTVVTYFTKNKPSPGHEITTDMFINGIQIPNNVSWIRLSRLNLKASTEIYKFYGTISKQSPCIDIIQDGGYCKIFNTIGVIGDEFSLGRMDNSNYNNATDNEKRFKTSWIQQIARYTNSTAYNFSMNGLSAHSLWHEQDNNIAQIITNLEDPNKRCDAYFIALGRNDNAYMKANLNDYSIGSTEHIHTVAENNTDSYCGNIGRIISKIQTIAPSAKIFLITMKNGAFSSFNQALRTIPEIFNTPNNKFVYLLDMAIYIPEIKFGIDPQEDLYYSYQISSYVDWYIRNYPNEFKY